jgi:hypothetical protein
MQQINVALRRQVPHALKIILAISILTTGGILAVIAETTQVSADVSGIVLSYPVSEGTGTTTADMSGNAQKGTLTNGPVWATGKYGTAVKFDGKNDYIQTAHTAALNITGNQISLSAWISPASISSTRVIVGKPASATQHISPNYSYALLMVSGVPRFHVRLGNTTYTLNAATTLTTNTWKHIAGTYDGTTMRLYIDGVLSASKTATGNVTPFTTPLRIGANGGLAQLWSGSIDDIRVYNRALTAAEIQTDMSASAGTNVVDTTVPTVSITTPTANATVANTVNVAVSASDNVAVAGVQFFVDGVASGAEDTASPYTLSWNTVPVANGVHTVSARARDLSGNVATATISVIVANDLVAPSVPTNLTASSVTQNSAVLSWTASTDDVGVAGYRVYKNGTLVTSVTGTTYTASGLTASTAYTFGVAAYDATGNTSATVTVSTTTLAPVQSTSTSMFPLQVASDGKHMIDAQGNNFVLQGEAAWSLIVQLTLPEVRQYLDDRKQKGFNTVMVNLVEHEYADNPPLNANGDAPFTNTHDMSTTKEAYFAFVDQVLAEIASRDMLVLLFPAYVGCCGGDGWRLEMGETGATKMRTYGQYLGTRYGAYENIIWMMGGDGAPAGTIDEIRALVSGIEDTAGPQLFSVHNGRYQSGVTQYPVGESWIDINTTYAGCEDPSYIQDDAERTPAKPFFYIEGWYENEGGEVAMGCLRSQAYQPLLMGAFGHVFGNNPIWNFEGRPITPIAQTWQQALNSSGSFAMSYVSNLVASRPWELLEPDFAHTVMTAGYGTVSDYYYASAARASDGSTVIAYIPSQRTVTINLSALSGTQTRAWWFNVATGSSTLIGTYGTTGSQTFTVPSYGEAVLVIDDVAKGYTVPGTGTFTGTTTPPVAPTLTFNAAPTAITAGQSSTLTWSSTDSTSCTASGAWTGAKATSGTTSVSPMSTSTYSLYCTGAGGNTTVKSVTVGVTPTSTPPVAPTLTFNAAPTAITAGQSATLTWSSTDSTSCTASGAWTGAKATSGTTSVSPMSTSTYSLYCTGAGGNTATQNVTVTVTAVPVAPTLTFSAAPTAITAGQSSTLTWSSTNSTACTAGGNWTGTKTTSGTTVVSPSVTATYTLYCTGAGGNTATQNAVVTVTPVSTSTPTTTGLAVAYNFNEGSGTTLFDRSGNGRNGTISGTPTWTTGKNGQTIDFDGSNDNVALGTLLPIQGVNKLTLSAWMKRNSAYEKVEIGKQVSGGSNTVALEFWDDGLLYFGLSPSSAYAGGYVSLNDTAWHHVTMVFDGTQSTNATRLKGYVDGVQQTLTFDGTVPTLTTTNTTGFNIGVLAGAYTGGLIDDVRVYTRALSTTEVQTDMVTPVQ